ncbi:MAG: protein YkaA [Pseudomonadota bacterium]|jgi:uncharacterized protein Yka (UPF0111/DUF47 family)
MEFNLIPKNDAYFADFDEAVVIIKEMVSVFQKHMEGPVPSNIHEIATAYEKKSDVVVRRCMERLNASFVTPIEREDILALMNEIDDVADALEGAASRLDMYGFTEVNDVVRAQLAVLERAMVSVGEAVRALRTLDAVVIHAKVAELNGLEKEADKVFRDGLRALFASRPDAVDLLRWKEIYEILEDAADACRAIGRTIYHVLVRHS